VTVEAEALAAMYEDPAQAPSRCRQILDAALAAHRRPPPRTYFVRSEDRRHAEVPRVAVIASLYGAADKLPHFLHALRCQTLLSSRQMEVIFVDSGSPDDEYAALTRTLDDFSIPFLYVRTAARETIQTVWNHGISLARAPYLSFLGVDETVTPDALETLADVLDSDPAVDWVQGDSLLTEVDGHGRWSRDVKTYDRDGYTQNHVYLETCYLSWVGAMYRRSIHDRFGYYDGRFRAAGDTEFKGRILPFIKTRHVPKLLGLFNNYPDPRATGSPLAKLEDIRAWYLHRTPGGIRYAMESRDPCEVEKLLLLSLRYRKSYTNHWSTDFEYAAPVAAHLRELLPTSPLLSLVPGIDRLLRAARLHDHPRSLGPIGFAASLREARAILVDVQAEL
jgi:glycosyltransferase involved in cell wall biosynthesis